MIKFRSHRTANSREFQTGAPGEWPQIEERVADSRRLTAGEIAAGFSLITDNEHAAIRAQYKAAWDTWEDSRKTAEVADKQTRRQEFADSLTAVQTIEGSVGNLSAAQLSNAVRALANLCRLEAKAIREILDA